MAREPKPDGGDRRESAAPLRPAPPWARRPEKRRDRERARGVALGVLVALGCGHRRRLGSRFRATGSGRTGRCRDPFGAGRIALRLDGAFPEDSLVYECHGVGRRSSCASPCRGGGFGDAKQPIERRTGARWQASRDGS